ncbi:hypothetical protein OXYTRIMIC_332 [Oxytricha trifallax]|uniref:USP domain-containing protein n=1 Tax=Oxytricha trifallax TaxID=1172189 RepID=A0A073HXD1_9SPIT|nr:hypothetical protein OXYTRIMIC_332 [Oxytricha trifallax]
MVQEIYNKLEQANLNLMIETGYKQLFNDDPALDQDQIDQEVDDRMDEDGNMVIDQGNIEVTQPLQYDIKHTQDQVMKDVEEEKTQQIVIQAPVIEEVKENPFLANKGHDLQNNPFIRRNNNQLRYPFARWFNNSCLHDCLMYIFYFGIYNQHQEIHNNQVDQCLQPLVNSCIELDKIDINRTYIKSSKNYPYCERQFNAIQPLRVPYGGDMIDAEELKEYFQNSSHFSLTVNRQESCGRCGYEDQEQTLQEYMINIVELSNGKVSDAVKNYYNQQRLRCPACNYPNLTIKGTLLLAPDYLVVAVRRGVNPKLKLDDKIRFKLLDNTVVKYEIKGIIYYSRYGSATTAGNHFVAKLKDGVHKDGTEMKGWWYYDGKMDHDLNVVKETDLTSALNIRADAARDIIYPNVLIYKKI